MAQTPASGLNTPKCPQHSQNEVIYVCEEESCNVELACCDCITTEHKGHNMKKLKEFVAEKKEKITVSIQQIETEKSVWQENIAKIDVKVGENNSNSEKIEKEIGEKRNQLKNNIDTAAESAIGPVTQVFGKNTQILRDHKEKLDKGVKKLNQQIHKMKEILDTGSNIDIYHFDIPSSTLPLEIMPVMNELVYISARLPSSDEIRDSMFSFLTSEKAHSQLELGDIFSKPVTHFEIKEDDVLCPTHHDDCLWIARYNKALLLMNSKGKIEQEIKLDSNLRCMYLSVSPEDTLWMICEDKTVRSITSAQTVIAHFSVASIESPVFCITNDNNILIADLCTLSLYTKTGEVICKRVFNTSGESTIGTPVNIACCLLTGLVVITDEDTSKESGSVIGFNRDLTIRFQFKGYEASPSERKEFRPMGVTFDSVGNVLIADNASQSVNLINADGLYMKDIVYIEQECNCLKQLWLKKKTLWMSVVKIKKTFFSGNELVPEIWSYSC